MTRGGETESLRINPAGQFLCYWVLRRASCGHYCRLHFPLLGKASFSQSGKSMPPTPALFTVPSRPGPCPSRPPAHLHPSLQELGPRPGQSAGGHLCGGVCTDDHHDLPLLSHVSDQV